MSKAIKLSGINIYAVLYLCCIFLFSISCSDDKEDILPDNNYNLTIKVQPEDAGVVEGEGEYAAGEEVTVSAVPNKGYWFVNWTNTEGHIISQNESYDFIMPAYDDTLTANFEDITDFEIHFIDVGQGDAILITTNEKVLLVDAGWNDGIAAGYLSALDIESIDIAIATHPHAVHIGGFHDIFEDYDVGEVIDPGVVHSSWIYERYLYLIEKHNITYTEGRKGLERELGGNAYLEEGNNKQKRVICQLTITS